MWLDLRHAVRALRRTPGFTLITVFSLALAIGANGAIFSLIDGLWFRPPGIADPGSLVRLFSITPQARQDGFSFPEYRDISERSTSFSGVVARGRRGALLNNGAEPPDLLLVNVVSLNFFTTLGITAHAGRLFAPGDEAALDRQPAVVLGHAFWTRRFGADPSIVGRTLLVGRERPFAVTVMGVLPAAFRDLDAAGDRDLWMPPPTWLRQTNASEFEQRDYRWFELFARLRPGVTDAQARAEVGAIAQAIAASYPATNTGRSATVVTDRRYRLESAGINAVALMGVIVLIVLITCVNVANLLLARAAAQGREIAVRLALGATRTQIVRQLFTETAVIGLLGGLAGGLVTVWLIGVLPAIVVQPPGLPSFVVFAADRRVAVATIVLTGVTTLLFGLMPGWIGSRAELVPVMKGDEALPVMAGGHRRIRNALAVVQVAVSLALLCSAAVLGKSFFETRRADIGIERKPILTAWSTFTELTPSLERQVLDGLRALPGVADVAFAIRAPLSLSGGGMTQRIAFPDRPADPGAAPITVKNNAVSAGYFKTIGTRVVRGRVFVDEERQAPVAVVNEKFVDQFFSGADALDRVVIVNGVERRIIGVVQNAAINQVTERREAYLYLPFTRAGEVTFLLALHDEDAVTAAQVRDTLRRIDDRLAPRRVVSMSQLIDYSARDYKMTAALVGALGAIGLLLTTMGVYGVVAYNTSQRTREIGIRSAIGATRAQVVRLILADGARLTIVGLACGLPLALWTTWLLSSFLFSTAPWEVMTFAGAAVVVIAATLAASVLPALRASSINVTEALRHT